MKKRFTFLMAAVMLLLNLITWPKIALGQTRAEGDTHDFAQTLSQLLNNNASISDIDIEEQSYKVKQVDVTYSWNNATTYLGKVSIEVTVGGTSFGTQVTAGKTATLTFTHEATAGAIKIKSTNNTGNGTGHGTFKITNVKLTEGANYTITAESNNNDYGTVSLSSSTITAAPADGYRVKAGSAGYTVTTGTATVTNNGDNTFSVTPSSDCTVRINFEAIPPHTLSSTASPAEAGTVLLGNSSVMEGYTTTATATANAGYKFTGWSIAGTGATLSSTTDNPTTVTMGTDNATVTATFEAATTYEIKWSVNGSIVKTENIEENTAITFAAPTSGIPAGYTFKGWVAAANQIDGVTDTDPSANYVTSANSTANITYYAVMAVLTGHNPDTYEKLTSDAFETDATYVIGADQLSDNDTKWYFYSYSEVDEDLSWGVMTTDPDTDTPVFFSLSGTASALIAQDTDGNYLSVSNDNKKFRMSSTSTTITLDDDGSIIEGSSLLRHNYNSGNGGLRWYGSTTGTQAYFFKVISGDVYSGFCTEINTFNNNGDWDTKGNWSWNVVPTTEPSVGIKATCTIPSSVIASANNIIVGAGGNLTIADGGQLITSNAVQATVQKSIAKWDDGSVNGWYFIASPVAGSIDPDDADLITDNLGSSATTSDATYDLFALDMNQSDKQWRNYRQATFNLANGSGYLYANKSDVTLNFTGAVVPSNEDKEVKDLIADEFNLVGNPFTCEAYLNQAYYTLSQANDGIESTTTATVSSVAIAPCTGVIVQTPENTTTVTFSKTASAKSGNINVNLVDAQDGNGTVDNAIVTFNENVQLGKFYFGTQNANIYIPQGNKEYAIVSAEPFGTIPVNFRAEKDGQYTLNIGVEEAEMNYLHLVDNMTGADVDLLVNPSYTFNACNNDYESRFKLVFSSSNTDEAEAQSDFAFISNGNLIVAGTGTLQIVDMMGRTIGSYSTSDLISTSDLAQGVYVLRLVNGDNVKTQKIVVK